MAVFGEQWIGYTEKIQDFWQSHIHADDLILIPGDISWAMRIEEVVPDLQWIHQLPGTKLLLRGNHDYWWTSLSKIEKILPPSIHLIQNNSFQWKGVSIGGGRLWDSSEYNFAPYVNYVENPRAKILAPTDELPPDNEKIFQRELGRLETSLKSMSSSAHTRIAMTHYPPIGANLQPTEASRLLEKYNVSICVFGHLHNIKKMPLFGEANGIRYLLTSCDYIDFTPIKICD